MARVFRHQYKARDGTIRTLKKWYIEYTDPATGRKARCAGYTDRKATQSLAARLETEAAQRNAGILPLEIDQRTLRQHLDDYVVFLQSKGNTPKYVRGVREWVERTLTGTRTNLPSELSASRVTNFLATLPISIAGRNQHIKSIKGFARWLWTEGRTPTHTLANLRTLNPDADLRHPRRVLTPAEFDRLIDATRCSGVSRYHMDPFARAWLYLTAAHTGLRARELASLTADSFDFRSDPPSVTVAASHSKHRKQDTVPLPRQFAVELAAWVQSRRTLWPGRWYLTDAAKMLRKDLACAGIAYQTDAGVFDFHAMRGLYITSLIRAGATLHETQRLARHSTPGLTSKHYARLDLTDLGRAADLLDQRGHGAQHGAGGVHSSPLQSTDEQQSERSTDGEG